MCVQNQETVLIFNKIWIGGYTHDTVYKPSVTKWTKPWEFTLSQVFDDWTLPAELSGVASRHSLLRQWSWGTFGVQFGGGRWQNVVLESPHTELQASRKACIQLRQQLTLTVKFTSVIVFKLCLVVPKNGYLQLHALHPLHGRRSLPFILRRSLCPVKTVKIHQDP